MADWRRRESKVLASAAALVLLLAGCGESADTATPATKAAPNTLASAMAVAPATTPAPPPTKEGEIEKNIK